MTGSGDTALPGHRHAALFDWSESGGSREKGVGDRIPREFAVRLIEAWTRFRIHEMTLPVLSTASRIRNTHCFSFWDSPALAAEDLQHGQRVEGMTILNPFR